MNKFLSERIQEVYSGLYIYPMDDFEKKICKVEGENWFIGVRFPKKSDDGKIMTQYKDRSLNNSQIEYLKEHYKDVEFKKYSSDLGYWIFRKD